MALQLTALAALAENPGLVPSITWRLTTLLTPVLGDPRHQAHMRGTYIYINTHKK